jgi:hypothetical protein
MRLRKRAGKLIRSFAARKRKGTGAAKPAKKPFPGSRTYWEERYAGGGDSGAGSYSKFAQFKAEVLNSFVVANSIDSVIEFGCGDGNQLMLANYPRYIGFDVSATAVNVCQEKFTADHSKSFKPLELYEGETADLALSLDVIFHLLEDDKYEEHMHILFDAAKRFVIIYSSDTDDNDDKYSHVKHRRFTKWVEANAAGWSLDRHVPNKYPYTGDHRQGSFADFYIYKRVLRDGPISRPSAPRP